MLNLIQPGTPGYDETSRLIEAGVDGAVFQPTGGEWETYDFVADALLDLVLKGGRVIVAVNVSPIAEQWNYVEITHTV